MCRFIKAAGYDGVEQTGDAPILIRIDTVSGHGASSTTKAIEQTADIYSFLFKNLAVEYR